MQIVKNHPSLPIQCRNDGAVLIPPDGRRFKTFRWTFGSSDMSYGYRHVKYHGKFYRVHRLICEAFHGPAPEDKPFVDHINRVRDDNRPENLRWASSKENSDNRGCVGESAAKYEVRSWDKRAAYNRAYYKAYSAEKRAQGLTWRKGPDGKYGWFPLKLPRKCTETHLESTIAV